MRFLRTSKFFSTLNSPLRGRRFFTTEFAEEKGENSRIEVLGNLVLFFLIGLFEFTEGKNGILDGKASAESKRAQSSPWALIRSFGPEDEYLVLSFPGSMVRGLILQSQPVDFRDQFDHLLIQLLTDGAEIILVDLSALTGEKEVDPVTLRENQDTRRTA